MYVYVYIRFLYIYIYIYKFPMYTHKQTHTHTNFLCLYLSIGGAANWANENVGGGGFWGATENVHHRRPTGGGTNKIEHAHSPTRLIERATSPTLLMEHAHTPTLPLTYLPSHGQSVNPPRLSTSPIWPKMTAVTVQTADASAPPVAPQKPPPMQHGTPQPPPPPPHARQWRREVDLQRWFRV